MGFDRLASLLVLVEDQLCQSKTTVSIILGISCEYQLDLLGRIIIERTNDLLNRDGVEALHTTSDYNATDHPR